MDPGRTTPRPSVAYRLTPERRDASLSAEQQATAAYRLTRLWLAGYQDAHQRWPGPRPLAYQESDVNDTTGWRRRRGPGP